ncbi:MAG TPA: NADH-quinone oxidoreductase subunit NuoK [Clostridiales bacterium]|nr:NADH-quinone oxidoreductase subunit NuoK [Clostridiales bacterium]
MIDVQYAVVLGVLLFGVGLFGALRSTNAVRILMCIELMLNAVNLNFVAFARMLPQGSAAGQVFAIFVMAVAAAEAAVGLAIILQVVRQRGVAHVDRINLLKG